MVRLMGEDRSNNALSHMAYVLWATSTGQCQFWARYPTPCVRARCCVCNTWTLNMLYRLIPRNERREWRGKEMKKSCKIDGAACASKRAHNCFWLGNESYMWLRRSCAQVSTADRSTQTRSTERERAREERRRRKRKKQERKCTERRNEMEEYISTTITPKSIRRKQNENDKSNKTKKTVEAQRQQRSGRAINVWTTANRRSEPSHSQLEALDACITIFYLALRFSVSRWQIRYAKCTQLEFIFTHWVHFIMQLNALIRIFYFQCTIIDRRQW